MKTVLGIDLGTQSLKVVVYDYSSHAIVASNAASLDVDKDANGKAEQNADDWLAAMRSALGELDKEVRESVQAVAVSGQQHGFVALDEAGDVICPVKLWCDTSTQAEADEITTACGGQDACIALTGNPVLTGYTSPKIRWLRNHQPELYRRLRHIALPHDYLNYLLTGRLVMEHGDASGTGLLDVRQRRWSPEVLRAVDEQRDLYECLPTIVEAGSSIGITSVDCERRFGLPRGIPVATGGGDNMMAAIGTGNVLPGRLTMSLGTSGTLFASADSPVVDDSGNIAAFCNSTGGWLPLLCTLNCTSATELVRSMLGIELSDFDRLVESAEPGCQGLTVLPFFAGERTPNVPHANAQMHGMQSHNVSAAHLMRGTVEGVTFGLRFGLDELRRLGVTAKEIVVTGGGAQSRAWRQVVANACALPVVSLAVDEGAGFGAAMQALWLLERESDPAFAIESVVDEHVQFADRIEPRAADIPVLADAYSRYRSAVESLK